jgi:hypothetical protein
VSVVLPFAQVLKAYFCAHVVRRARVRLEEEVSEGHDLERLKMVKHSSSSSHPSSCALCDSPAILPVCDPRSDCRHSFCYGCLKVSLMEVCVND